MTTNTTATSPFLPSRVYDALVWIAQIFLPAVGALYYGLADLWNLPLAIQVVGTITLVDLFLGTLLKVSKSNYNKAEAWADGKMIVHHEDGVPVGINADLENIRSPLGISDQDRVTFKVVHNDLEV